MGDRGARMRSTLSDTFWILVLSIVVLFAFFIALGAFHPGDVGWLTLAVLALALLWTAHAAGTPATAPAATPRRSATASGGASELRDARPGDREGPRGDARVHRPAGARGADRSGAGRPRGRDRAPVRPGRTGRRGARPRRSPRPRARSPRACTGRRRDAPLPLVVYLHGGGWMLGSIESFDTLVRALANASGAIVVSVGYRLAPEAPFPAGLEDCLCAVRWLAANAAELGADPERLAIAGDSAGGNLATVVARRLRGEVELRMQALIYPVTDAGCNTASYREFGEGHGLTAASMQRFWNLYLDGADGLDPDASPLRADDLAGSPPAFVLTAELRPAARRGRGLLRGAARGRRGGRGQPLRRRDPRLLALARGHEALATRGRRGRGRAARPARLSGTVGSGTLDVPGSPPGDTVPGMAATPTTATSRFWHPFADMGAVSPARAADRARGGGVGLRRRRPPLPRRHREPLVREHRPRQPRGRRRASPSRCAAWRPTRPSATSATGRRTSCPSASPRTRRWTARAIFLTSGGGDSIDAAAKIARRHWIQQGQPERVHLISRTQGYHGTHGFGTSIGGIEANTSNWGPLVPAVSAVAHDSLPALEAEIERVGPEHVAAFFCEPVIGAGGVYPPPEGYIEGVADLCAEHGILLVIDSVDLRLRPARHLVRDRALGGRAARHDHVRQGRHRAATCRSAAWSSPTRSPARSSSPRAARCSATAPPTPATRRAAPPGMAVMDVYERDGLFERSRALEGALAEALAPLAYHPAVAEVRAGLGLLAAVQLSPEALEREPGAVAKVAAGAREAGVLVRPLLGAVAMSPPLTVEQEHIDLLVEAIGRAGLALGVRVGGPVRWGTLTGWIR